MLKVVVIAFDRISPFHLSVPCVVFGDPHPLCPPIDFKVCAAEAGMLEVTAGFRVHTQYNLEPVYEAEIIIVPSWRDPHEKPPSALLTSLQMAAARGAKIVGLCLGAYVLAEAGLLEQRQATTHWAYAQDFATRYPHVKLDPAVLYVEDQNMVTSAGTAAGLDCCLYLLRQQFGAEIANHVARRLVIAPYRQGGQAQFIEYPMPAKQAASRLATLLDWVRGHLAEKHTVASVAERALMSRRTFTRQFKQLTGMSFISWLLAERLTYAQHLLASTEKQIDHIAEQAGFGSTESFRVHFRRYFGITPVTWRKQFSRPSQKKHPIIGVFLDLKNDI